MAENQTISYLRSFVLFLVVFMAAIMVLITKEDSKRNTFMFRTVIGSMRKDMDKDWKLNPPTASIPEPEDSTTPLFSHPTPSRESHTTTPEAHNGDYAGLIDPMAPELQLELRKRLRQATEKKSILVWHPMFGVKDEISLNTSDCGNCEVTYDRNKISDPNTFAVVFHFHAVSASSMPSVRNPDQLYIYWVKEAPPALRQLRGITLNFEDEYGFNATMNYRRNSDFYNSYMTVPLETIIAKNKLSLPELLKMKTKTAVVIVSNCGFTPGAVTRMKYLKEVQDLGFKLEGFGNCFRGSGRFANGGGRRTEIFQEEIRTYKFYFSFENSHHCEDYITEKFFHNALGSLTVPVAWGGSKKDYEKVAPPGSFIHFEDFPSIKELVEYLQYLERNDTAYMEYFKWLSLDRIQMPQYGRAESFCAICRSSYGINIDDMYNPQYDPSRPARPLFTDAMCRRTVPSLKGWYYGEENEECFRG